ncbi:MAG: zinc-binding dehydrogenase [Armatimonadetes bacterium]|nr:zinc-binding dehydrogenase [Armatimonadota bacterium]
MRAVTFHEHGDVGVLRYEDVPEPVPGPGEVVIRVRAIGCNYNDLWARRGLPGMKFDLPHISGSDAAGEIAAVGPGVSGVKAGDAVVVHPSISCRTCEACTAGQEYFCRHFKIWGFQTGPLDGSYAEYAKVPAANAVPKPARLTWEEAASIPLVLLTTYHMLVTRAQLRTGEWILVWGATSGIGIVAVQLARHMGASVVAVAGSEEKLAAARDLGAHVLVNYKTQDVVDEVRKATGRRGVDVVFEHTGQETWERSLRVMAWGARLVTCGNTTGFQAITDLRFLFNKQLSLLGSHQGNKAELMAGLRLVEAGHIKPVVGKVFPLREAAAAQTAIETGNKIGKIVLVP